MRFAALLALLLSLAGCTERAAVGKAAAGLPSSRDDPAGRCIDDAAALIRRGELSGARRILEAVLAERPAAARAWFYLALTFHKEKRYALARAGFERVLAGGGNFDERPQAHHFHGWCLYNLGDLDGARRAFETHLEHSPDAADTHCGLGLVDLEEGRLEGAELRFRRAIAIEAATPGREKEAARARVRLADVHLLLGRLEEAREELRLATRLWPECYPAYWRLHQVLARLGDAAGAAEARERHDRLRAAGTPGDRG